MNWPKIGGQTEVFFKGHLFVFLRNKISPAIRKLWSFKDYLWYSAAKLPFCIAKDNDIVHSNVKANECIKIKVSYFPTLSSPNSWPTPGFSSRSVHLCLASNLGLNGNFDGYFCRKVLMHMRSHWMNESMGVKTFKKNLSTIKRFQF